MCVVLETALVPGKCQGLKAEPGEEPSFHDTWSCDPFSPFAGTKTPGNPEQKYLVWPFITGLQVHVGELFSMQLSSRDGTSLYKRNHSRYLFACTEYKGGFIKENKIKRSSKDNS